MKPKKNIKEVFSPKKVHIKKYQRKSPGKLATGARFGKKWFPHTKAK